MSLHILDYNCYLQWPIHCYYWLIAILTADDMQCNLRHSSSMGNIGISKNSSLRFLIKLIRHIEYIAHRIPVLLMHYYVCCMAICTLVVIYTVFTYALLSAQPAALQSVEFAIHLIIVNQLYLEMPQKAWHYNTMSTHSYTIWMYNMCTFKI